jgi:nicotinamidase-related amidase
MSRVNAEPTAQERHDQTDRRPNTALLVIDVQNDVVAEGHNRDSVISNLAFLVDKARAKKVPVVWVQHSSDDLPEGSDGWRYVPELTQQESEPVIHKRYPDSFEDT